MSTVTTKFDYYVYYNVSQQFHLLYCLVVVREAVLMYCICAVVLTTPCRLDKVRGPGDHHPGDGLQTEVGAPAGKLVGPGSGERTDGSEQANQQV